MPGFVVGGDGDGPSGVAEYHRSHRFRIKKLGPIIFKSNQLFYAKSVQLPNISFDVEIINTGSSIPYKFPKAMQQDDIVVEFYDVIGIYEKLMTWQDKIWDSEKGIRPADDFMDTCEFELGNDQPGKNIEGYTIKCYNCWPKKIDHSPLTYENSNIKSITLTIVCTHTEVEHTTSATGVILNLS
jgi:hypothetical protein